MKSRETEVAVVGGSLVGLSAAVFLAARGVRVVVIEKHRGSAKHPRAVGYPQRTMELFAAVGLAERIPQAPPTFRLLRRRVESVYGHWHEESEWTPPAKGAAPPPTLSPHTGAAIAQDVLEPLLRARALELGAELRLGTELESFQQDEQGVTLRLRDEAGPSSLRAAWLLGCDGNQSGVREALGIGRTGHGVLQVMRSVLFSAPQLDEILAQGVAQFEIEQPGLRAFLTTYGGGRWVLMFHDDVERDPQALRDAITRAVGRALPVELITTGRWELTALIADRFREGRVFLAGDAAHTLPPTRGGYGANTGIHDVWNLAWKLAAVCRGQSRAQLLDTYDTERRPIAWLRFEQTFARPDYARFAGQGEAKAILDPLAIELGELYRSPSILGADASLPPARRPDLWHGQPGTRLPWLPLGDGRSTLELAGRGWLLLSLDAVWAETAATLPLVTTAIVSPADPAAFALALGLEPRGALLVRPDGVIAWRSSHPAHLAAALAQAAMSAA